MIYFVLVKDTHVSSSSGKRGMSIPKEDEFRAVVNSAIVNTVTINIRWCNVVERSGIMKAGLGLIKLNYGYPDGVAVFRDSVTGQSTNDVTYNTYPAADLIIYSPRVQGNPQQAAGRWAQRWKCGYGR